MRLAVILLALMHFGALAVLALEYGLTAEAPDSVSPAGRLLMPAVVVVPPLAGPALWLAARNRALPFALVLVLVLPAAVPIALLFG